MHTDGKKILVADDDTLVRKLIEEFLSQYGYAVDSTGNGEEAMALIRTKSYDILITDYMMPGINGIDLTKKVRGLNLALPIIGMSGSCSEREFITAGANLFIRKPLNLSVLKDVLERVFLI